MSVCCNVCNYRIIVEHQQTIFTKIRLQNPSLAKKSSGKGSDFKGNISSHLKSLDYGNLFSPVHATIKQFYWSHTYFKIISTNSIDDNEYNKILIINDLPPPIQVPCTKEARHTFSEICRVSKISLWYLPLTLLSKSHWLPEINFRLLVMNHLPYTTLSTPKPSSSKNINPEQQL